MYQVISDVEHLIYWCWRETDRQSHIYYSTYVFVAWFLYESWLEIAPCNLGEWGGGVMLVVSCLLGDVGPFWRSLLAICILFLAFRERGREGERDGENINVWLPVAYPLPQGELAHNLGMCPNWESNQWPFASQSSVPILKLGFVSLNCKRSVHILGIHNPSDLLQVFSL